MFQKLTGLLGGAQNQAWKMGRNKDKTVPVYPFQSVLSLSMKHYLCYQMNHESSMP